MPDLKELREKRQALLPRMNELRDQANDEGQDWGAEQEENWKAINDEYNALVRQIEDLEKRAAVAEAVDAANAATQEPPSDNRAIGRGDFDGRDGGQHNRPPPNDRDAPKPEDRALALQAWFRCGDPCGDLTDPQRQACERVGFNPYRRGLVLPMLDTEGARVASRAFRGGPAGTAPERAARALEQRAMSAVTGATGGFTVPTGFVNQLEINMLAWGGMLQTSDLLRTATGNPMEWPTADDTDNTGEQLGESASIGSSVEPTIGQLVFYAYKFHSKMVRIPSELLEDSAFDMVSVLGAMLGERLGRITNTRATTGTGAGTMRGLVTAATLGVTAAGTGAITFDELRELEHSVDPAYRNGARLMCHDSTVLHLRQLKDGNSQYLWDASTTDGQPDRLDSYPITVNQDMAELGTGNKTVLFGQLSKYKIRQVNNMRLMRLDERYADYDQVAFDVFIRQDGNLIDAGTAPVKYIQQA